MNRGYIKTWRKSLDSPSWKNLKLWRFWEYCLLKASYKNYTHIVGYQEINLNPGQFIFGRKKASEQTGLSERSIRTCINLLKNNKQITISATSKFSIITIINWYLYQDDDEITTNNRPAKPTQPDQQTTSNIDQYAPVNKDSYNYQNNKATNKATNKKSKSDHKQEVYIHQFEKFWNLYDKKSSRKKCEAKFKKLKQSEIELIFQTLPAYLKTTPDPQYRKNPLTYLNGNCWEDELNTKPEKKKIYTGL